MKLSLLVPFLSGTNLTARQIAEFNRQIRRGTVYAGRLTAQERALLIRLLSESERLPGTAHVITEKVQGGGNEALPSLLFGVLAPDWAGLADACLGTVHEAGLNIAYTHGFILRRQRQKLGVILMELEVAPTLTSQALDMARSKIQERLARIAAEDEAKKTLQRQESRRLYAFTAVTDILKAQVGEQELKEILGDNGEAIKFFIARQESYINQRPIEAIAHQVLRNFRLKELIRSGKSSLEAEAGPMPFGYKDLTAITVVTKEPWLTYELLIRLIEQEIPGFHRYDEYTYFTTDKISVYHLEITDRNDRALEPKTVEALLQKVKTPPSSREALGPTPGVELIRRKIIPPMLDEEKELRIPQGYIHPHAPDHYKLIVVGSGNDAGHGLDLLAAISSVPGLSAAMPDKPSHMRYIQNGLEQVQEISIIDIWVDRRALFSAESFPGNEEEIYNKIEQAVRSIQVFGPRLRIFDRTSRALRQARLAAVLELAAHEGITAQEIKSLFYNLGDKCLLDPEVSDALILSELKLWSQTQKPAQNKGMLAYRFQDLQNEKGDKGFTALAVALPAGHPGLAKVLSLASDYHATSACRSDANGLTSLLFIFSTPEGPVSPLVKNELSSALERIG